MRFSHFLTLASLATAAPVVEQRQQTVVGTIFGSVRSLEVATQSNFHIIDLTVESVKDNVGGTVEAQVTATLKANYRAILRALRGATTSIVSVTTGAAGGVTESAKNLGQQEINLLVRSIQASTRVVSQLGATLTLTVTDLTPSIKTAIDSEFSAVKDAINPFAQPLLLFIAAAREASVEAGLTVTGLDAAQQAFSSVILDVGTSLGLPDLEEP
ncbi:hypothetical protein G7046_g3085 [Stylonectria norvegica]|nr:hypothetical protein G7046_g3085 [Stylonectria norvegica]